MLHHVALVRTSVSMGRIAAIIRLARISKQQAAEARCKEMHNIQCNT
jgi:hypothetical protein